MSSNLTKYWLGVVSKEHVLRGVEGSFIQVCHGKEKPLKRMYKGDWIIYYSSKISMSGDEKLQAFTAIGKTKDDIVYQFSMSADFLPFRRNVEFLPCQEASILPLIQDLEFIPNKQHWGYPFRYGFLELNKHDFELIKSKMLPA
jgi:hypothetical protein